MLLLSSLVCSTPVVLLLYNSVHPLTAPIVESIGLNEDPSGPGWFETSHATAVTHAGFIYLIGGTGSGGNNDDELIRRSANGVSWTSYGNLWEMTANDLNEYYFDPSVLFCRWKPLHL